MPSSSNCYSFPQCCDPLYSYDVPASPIPPLQIPIVQDGTLEVGGSRIINYPIQATNYPTSYGATDLPDGLSINTITGVISGIITSTDQTSYTVGLSATNSAGTGVGTLIIIVSYSETPMTVIFMEQVILTPPQSLQVSIDGSAYANVIFNFPYIANHQFKYKLTMNPGSYSPIQAYYELTLQVNDSLTATMKSGSIISSNGTVSIAFGLANYFPGLSSPNGLNDFPTGTFSLSSDITGQSLQSQNIVLGFGTADPITITSLETEGILNF